MSIRLTRTYLARVAALVVAGALATTLPVHANGNAAQPASPSAAEADMQRDMDRANKITTEGAMVGAAVGALAGGLLAKVAGGSSKDAGFAALAGAAAGGLIGGLDGRRTAKAEKAGNDQVKSRQDQLARIEADSSELRAVLASSQRVIAERELAIADIKRNLDGNRISAQQARDELRRDEINLTELRKTLDTQKKKYEEHVKLANSVKADDVNRQATEQQLGKFKSEIVAMESQIANYTTTVSSASRG